jgi:hypothetical protein
MDVYNIYLQNDPLNDLYKSQLLQVTLIMTLMNLSQIVVNPYAPKITFTMKCINLNVLMNNKYMPIRSLYDDS